MRFGPVLDIVRVLMMFIMNVGVGVLERLMYVLMGVTFANVKPHSSRHHQTCADQLPCDRVTQQQGH